MSARNLDVSYVLACDLAGQGSLLLDGGARDTRAGILGVGLDTFLLVSTVIYKWKT